MGNKTTTPNVTLIYDEALNASLRLNHSLYPLDMFRAIEGGLCEAYETTDALNLWIKEYEAKETLVNLRLYNEYVRELAIELEHKQL